MDRCCKDGAAGTEFAVDITEGANVVGAVDVVDYAADVGPWAATGGCVGVAGAPAAFECCSRRVHQ